MPYACRSANRCSDLRRPTCAWRYCRSQAIQILTKSNGPLHTITLTIPDPSPEGFRVWRIEIRNRVDYLRRKSSAWRNFGFHGWVQRDGTVRGIITLGRMGRSEVERGLTRWGATLGQEVGPEDLRVAIWRVTMPGAISPQVAEGRRYQGRRFAIHPRRPADRDTSVRPMSNPAHLALLGAGPDLDA